MTRKTTNLLHACLGAISVLLTACASPLDAPTSTHPYAHEFDKMRHEVQGKPSEPIVLQILDDGKISDEEVQSLAHQQTTCMEDAGFHGFTIDIDSGVTMFPPNLSDSEEKRAYEAEAACTEQTHFMWVDSLYFIMKTNPTNLPLEDVTAACLVKLKVVEPSYSGKEHRESMEKWAHDQNKPKDEEPFAAVPYIVDQETGAKAFRQCEHDPQGVLARKE